MCLGLSSFDGFVYIINSSECVDRRTRPGAGDRMACAGHAQRTARSAGAGRQGSAGVKVTAVGFPPARLAWPGSRPARPGHDSVAEYFFSLSFMSRNGVFGGEPKNRRPTSGQILETAKRLTGADSGVNIHGAGVLYPHQDLPSPVSGALIVLGANSMSNSATSPAGMYVHSFVDHFSGSMTAIADNLSTSQPSPACSLSVCFVP